MIAKTRATLAAKTGQIVLPIIMALVVLSTLISLMVMYVQREAVWTVKETRNTTAFHLAEAGQEKGLLEISLSTSVWSGLQNGTQITGFKFDTAYSDETGGTYTISITSGPSANQATIISVGRDSLKRELRAIKTVYSVSGISSALYAATISMPGNNTDVEWGSIASEGAITLHGNNIMQCWPQIWAVGAINNTGNSYCSSCVAAYAGGKRCTTAGWNNNSSNPCTDSVSWWSNNCSPGVPIPPTINLAGYKAAAQADHCAEAGMPSGASPAGSCYWPSGTSPTWSGNNFSPGSTHTYYTDDSNGFTISGNNYCMRGTMIIASPSGGFSFTGNNGTCSYTIPDGLTPHGIPSTAWKQYQLKDTAASSEYFGDAGYQQVSSSFTFGATGSPTKALGTTYSPLFRGFLYIGSGALNIAGNNIVFHGVVYSPNGVSGITGNNAMFFYDSDVAGAIQTSGGTPSRQSWQDLAYSIWPGP